MTIACVLRSGGDFDARWVRALANGVAKHLPTPYRFVCLSDVEVDCERIPLCHGWKGWWSKMEALALPPEYGQVLLMDLDTLPVGDMRGLASYMGDFAMIRNVGHNERLQSGVLAFRAGGQARKLYERFRVEGRKGFRGDGEWLEHHAERPDVLQDIYPGEIVSAKWDVGYSSEAPGRDVTLALGHGRPRFTDRKAGWAHRLWTERTA